MRSFLQIERSGPRLFRPNCDSRNTMANHDSPTQTCHRTIRSAPGPGPVHPIRLRLPKDPNSYDPGLSQGRNFTETSEPQSWASPPFSATPLDQPIARKNCYAHRKLLLWVYWPPPSASRSVGPPGNRFLACPPQWCQGQSRRARYSDTGPQVGGRLDPAQLRDLGRPQGCRRPRSPLQGGRVTSVLAAVALTCGLWARPILTEPIGRRPFRSELRGPPTRHSPIVPEERPST